MRIVALACLAATGCITTPGLYIEKTGDGEGRILSDPEGVDCGGDCGMLVEGPLTLTATPSKSSIFAGWSGLDACGADPVCSFTLLDDALLEARFEPFRPTLTVTPTEHATIVAEGIDCGLDCSESYAYATYVHLTVKPVPGWVVTGWTGVNCPTATCSVSVIEDTIATPILAEASTLHVTVVDYTGSGRVTSSPPGIECGVGSSTCEVPFAAGTVVTLTATSFNVEWTGCMQIPTNKNTCVVQVTGSVFAEASIR